MKIYLYISLLLILSFNQSKVLCWQIHYDNTGGTEEKDFELLSDNTKDTPSSWYNPIDNVRKLNHYDNDRIIFPDHEDSSKRHSTYKPLDVKTCVLSCKSPNSVRVLICGTDGKTYNNLEHLICAVKCGVDVRFRHLSSCHQSTGHNTLNETNNNINACISSCPTKSEYNPVCGSNNKTYTNLGKLHCAQLCGVDIQLKYHFACPKTPTTTENYSVSTRSPLPTETNSNLLVCLNTCPTTSEYNPVCGSDGTTYNNIGSLECAKYCGIDVQLRYYFVCPRTVSIMENRADSTGIQVPNQLIRGHNLL